MPLVGLRIHAQIVPVTMNEMAIGSRKIGPEDRLAADLLVDEDREQQPQEQAARTRRPA